VPPENPPAPEPPQGTEPPAPEQPPETPKSEEKKEKGKKEKTTTTEQEGGKKKGGGFWRSGWGVAVGLGGGAIVLGLLADSIAGDTAQVEQPPSQSTPE